MEGVASVIQMCSLGDSSNVSDAGVEGVCSVALMFVECSMCFGRIRNESVYVKAHRLGSSSIMLYEYDIPL